MCQNHMLDEYRIDYWDPGITNLRLENKEHHKSLPLLLVLTIDFKEN